MKLITPKNHVFVIILGTAQDGAIPHAGCHHQCCQLAWNNSTQRLFVTSLGIIDPQHKQRWLIDCTPDFKFQLHLLDKVTSFTPGEILDGIFLTHGHIGHFTGLINLEKAILNSHSIPVFAMPKMKSLLNHHQPWSNLVFRHNISLRPLEDNHSVPLNPSLSITPFLVPHRNEDTETVGFIIKGPHRKILFIPDTDTWENDIETKIKQSNLAILDGTFFDETELPHFRLSQVPHPFIKNSIQRFSHLPKKDRQKIHFIHLNHTNPALKADTQPQQLLTKNLFKVAKQGKIINI